MQDSRNSNSKWNHFDEKRYRAMDIVVILMGFLICAGLVGKTSHNSPMFFVWLFVLCFYFLFYRRLCQVIYWSWHTYRLQERIQATKDGKIKCDINGDRELPTFHVLIAAYNASDSIKPVIKAATNQDYPSEKTNVWVITEKKEQIAKNKRISKLVSNALSISERHDIDETTAHIFWYCISQQYENIVDWSNQITQGSLRGYLSLPGINTVLMSDLICRLLNSGQEIESITKRIAECFELNKKAYKILIKELCELRLFRNRVRDDFIRILGTAQVYDEAGITNQIVSNRVSKPRVRYIAKCICARFENDSDAVSIPDISSLNEVANSIFPSTQESIQTAVFGGFFPNVYHLDPHNRGYKPGALNFAYKHILSNNKLGDPANSYFIIIDADSLMPQNALRTLSKELSNKAHNQDIFQMISTPTANYFCEGWFSKFVSIADALGAVGKWARSTRRQLKPDLHAGSGVVIPAALADFIMQYEGGPWTESTLTEDARIIIGQFGMMRGATNKTKMVPVILLEAVPGEPGFLATYKSYWNQRRRWTLGGYDEFFYMLKTPQWLSNSKYNPARGKWEHYKSSERKNLNKSRVNRYYRVLLWLWDHFVWGIGGFIALTHWWLISFLLIEPSRPIAVIGMIALFVTPLFILTTSTRQLESFVPGGISKTQKVKLYFLSFIAIWLYCAPVVFTQMACLFGFRPQFVDWKPTRKPKYGAKISLDIGE